MKSLYVHIPFCDWVCHYCDFAKTANHSDQSNRRYLAWLESELLRWHAQLSPQYESVFFGGGTPSIFTSEYQSLMSVISASSSASAEISLEANPEHVTTENLAIWKDLGFNRISLGVQTFSENGLKFLTRKHLPAGAKSAIALAEKSFGNVNIDLMYGWPGQTIAEWQQDLKIAYELGVKHLSLYCLTYEPRTVLGRRHHRGLIDSVADDRLYKFYEVACHTLAGWSYEHEEVSNWSLPGFSCRHNWVYWSDAPYLGVGAGAHGYLPGGPDMIGRRFSYPFRSGNHDGPDPHFEQRNLEDWALEFIGSSLRTQCGTDIAALESRTGRCFKPNALLERGMIDGLVSYDQRRVRLNKLEWFRETTWCLAVYESLV